MKTLIRSGVALVAAAALGASMVVGGAALSNGKGDDKGNGLGGQPATASQIYLDEIKDYGVCRGTDPDCYHEWGNGWKEGEEKRILIWSRTAGPRHAHLGSPLPPGLNPPLASNNIAQAALIAWAAERGIKADYTEDLAQFRLNNYQAVVFLSSNRDTLDDSTQTTLMQYIRGGGGFVGIHNAFGAEYHWPYYEGLLGGANFYNHGPNRDGTVETINDNDVSTSFMPETWAFKDEWYNLVPYPSFVNVLLEVDQATSEATVAGHGESHPVSWCQYYDGGRSWLTTLGHDAAAWTSAPLAGDEFFKEHVLSGLESAMGIKPFCTT
ncbi:ThuA domain-containing protein [Microbacterium sp. CFBP9034]|uniref:ThuA domain-containing protein n=1 Tax=Microbacterium sp. CFBP9034 TaxID=3096540 RepID=UPI002A6AEF35|nr:ThuA domain-containing protein [Microbacterium sp. CFBP9034]MDY0908567.1 ThuA domain-containing protein [Microbacterium sp. CFBP9034]